MPKYFRDKIANHYLYFTSQCIYVQNLEGFRWQRFLREINNQTITNFQYIPQGTAQRFLQFFGFCLLPVEQNSAFIKQGCDIKKPGLTC